MKQHAIERGMTKQKRKRKKRIANATVGETSRSKKTLDGEGYGDKQMRCAEEGRRMLMRACPKVVCV